jgi:hypothetical protein
MAFKVIWNGLAVPDAPGLNLANATCANDIGCFIPNDYGIGASTRFYAV